MLSKISFSLQKILDLTNRSYVETFMCLFPQSLYFPFSVIRGFCTWNNFISKDSESKTRPTIRILTLYIQLDHYTRWYIKPWQGPQHKIADKACRSLQDFQQWQRAVSWFSIKVPLMFESELSGFFNSVPWAINDANTVLFSILKVFKGTLLFSKCRKDNTLELFLFVQCGE